MSAVGITARPASAIATFDFTQCDIAGQVENSTCGSSSYSNNAASAFSQTVDGVTVSATALASSGTSNYNDKNLNATAHVGQYAGYGLGVCSSGDTSCSDPQHQIDNNRSYEFILFKFSTPVSLSQITLANFGGLNSSGSFNTSEGGGDMDFSYWTGVSTASTTIGNLASPGAGWSSQNNVSCTGTKESTGCGTTVDGDVVTSASLTGSNVTYLLVGAAYNATSGCTSGATCGNTDSAADFFKIQALTVNDTTTTQISGAPEPGTLALLPAALVGLWMWRRRERRAA